MPPSWHFHFPIFLLLELQDFLVTDFLKIDYKYSYHCIFCYSFQDGALQLISISRILFLYYSITNNGVGMWSFMQYLCYSWTNYHELPSKLKKSIIILSLFPLSYCRLKIIGKFHSNYNQIMSKFGELHSWGL